jgi:cyclopropane-fatty-acyl-phospholipid synthase
MMEKLHRGQLRVLSSDGTMYTFGTPSIYSPELPNPNKQALPSKADEIRAEIRVVNDAFWVRMLLLSDLGFSEAWMAGDIEVDDLDALFRVSSVPWSARRELTSAVAVAAVHHQPRELG